MKEIIPLYISSSNGDEFEFRYTVEFDYHKPIYTEFNHNPALARIDQPEQFILKTLTDVDGNNMTQMLEDEKICDFIVESIKEGWA